MTYYRKHKPPTVSVNQLLKNPITMPFRPGEQCYLRKLFAEHDSPLVGLEELVELECNDKRFEPAYQCRVCLVRAPSHSIIDHLSCGDHISTYLEFRKRKDFILNKLLADGSYESPKEAAEWLEAMEGRKSVCMIWVRTTSPSILCTRRKPMTLLGVTDGLLSPTMADYEQYEEEEETNGQTVDFKLSSSSDKRNGSAHSNKRSRSRSAGKSPASDTRRRSSSKDSVGCKAIQSTSKSASITGSSRSSTALGDRHSSCHRGVSKSPQHPRRKRRVGRDDPRIAVAVINSAKLLFGRRASGDRGSPARKSSRDEASSYSAEGRKQGPFQIEKSDNRYRQNGYVKPKFGHHGNGAIVEKKGFYNTYEKPTPSMRWTAFIRDSPPRRVIPRSPTSPVFQRSPMIAAAKSNRGSSSRRSPSVMKAVKSGSSSRHSSRHRDHRSKEKKQRSPDKSSAHIRVSRLSNKPPAAKYPKARPVSAQSFSSLEEESGTDSEFDTKKAFALLQQIKEQRAADEVCGLTSLNFPAAVASKEEPSVRMVAAKFDDVPSASSNGLAGLLDRMQKLSGALPPAGPSDIPSPSLSPTKRSPSPYGRRSKEKKSGRGISAKSNGDYWSDRKIKELPTTDATKKTKSKSKGGDDAQTRVLLELLLTERERVVQQEQIISMLQKQMGK